MLVLQSSRAFLPIQDALGFGASDWLVCAIAALLLLMALAWRPLVEPYAVRLAERTGWCMLLLAVLPVALRLLLLPHHPVPTPDLYDEFGHLLVADTLRHFRLANPAHPLSQFFETFFVLQQPTYSSIYPIGQGLALAIGRMLSGQPWTGVLLATAAFCALCYWMLRAWTTPAWALAGGLLAAFEFGPLNQWMNGYWGGAVAAAAGCLVFGALPRLRRNPRLRDALLLGAGLALHLLTRPYESIFLLCAAALFFLPVLRRPAEVRALARVAPGALAVLLPAAGLVLLQNRQVTGSWTNLPYVLSQYQYGVPAALTFQANLVPHRPLTPQQERGYQMQLAFRGKGSETLGSFLARLEYRVRFYRFFFLPALYLALPFFLPAAREFRFAWVLLTLLLFALGVNFFPAYQHHYLAAVVCLFLLCGVVGLERLSRLRLGGSTAGAEAARLILFVCAAHFTFWYGLHLFDTREFSQTLREYETWNQINHQNPARRILVQRQLAQIPGKLLVFVRYWPQHIFQDEWVYNAADIDAARVVWARDLGPEENQELQRYYPDRQAWLLEPDARPPHLAPYAP
ncbi:MAG TPA: hypothetical protein VFA33_26570 [Bryobacteraceae bacterium]|nr:hypothetical protein [Bryobacteraceae bacterium]